MKPFLDITIGDVLELKKLEKMPLSEALPIFRMHRDKHVLTDGQAKDLMRISLKLNDSQ